MGLLSKISSVQRLAFGMTCLFVSLAMIASFFGLVPDERELKINARARVSEALSIQLAGLAMRGGEEAISSAITAIVARDPQILSIGMRKNDGALVALSQDHARLWSKRTSENSSPTHVSVPLHRGNSHWGNVEITYRGLNTIMMATGLSRQFLHYIGFTMLFGLFAAYLLLRRSLKQLDPSRAVPERVQNAFDSLSDGVAIVDESENILLMNNSLGELIGVRADAQVGRQLSGIEWNGQHHGIAPETSPWGAALFDNVNVRDVAFNVQSASGEMRNLLVNATCLNDDDGQLSGAIVAFKDVTVLEKKNQDLAVAIDQLSQTQSEINQQNKQLHYLANHDPLTGCMNRRSFFHSLSVKIDSARRHFRPICCLMIDIDHFKSINDELGHAAGDEVIAGLGQLLRELCRAEDFVGRYGGEEFCVILEETDTPQAMAIAERVRAAVASRSAQWLAANRPVTVSIGLSVLEHNVAEASEFIEQADQALYRAKRSGRNQVAVWGLGEPTDIAV